jgi:hypothetical protein
MTAPVFDITLDTMVVTTTYVTKDQMAIVRVSHEEDDDGSIVWQFHSKIEDYHPNVLQLVRLDTILRIDSGVAILANLPVGFSARRHGVGDEWIVTKIG